MHYVYFLQSLKDSTYYIGATSDIDKRVKEHNQGKTRSLKSKLPVKLVYFEEYNTKTDALKREIDLKKNWSKKEAVIKSLK